MLALTYLVLYVIHPQELVLNKIKGYYRCDKCCRKIIWNGKSNFPKTDAPLRVDAHFDERNSTENIWMKGPLYCRPGASVISQIPGFRIPSVFVVYRSSSLKACLSFPCYKHFKLFSVITICLLNLFLCEMYSSPNPVFIC